MLRARLLGDCDDHNDRRRVLDSHERIPHRGRNHRPSRNDSQRILSSSLRTTLGEVNTLDETLPAEPIGGSSALAAPSPGNGTTPVSADKSSRPLTSLGTIVS